MSENKMIKWKDKIRSGAVFFCLWGLSILYLGFNCFYHLDRTMVMSYDEARHGVNAFEMMRTGNYIVSTFNYHNDYWNLKPPMSFWAIILDFKIFGTTVLGLRFYSALALFLTILMISVFLLKRYGKIECLVITTMLACCFSFYAGHFGRNGDADALYGLFLTAGALALFYVKDNHAFLYLTGAMFSLAFLTKSWHAFILLAVTAACLAAGGQLKRIRPAEWLIFGLCSFGPILIWAAARFHYDGMRFFSGMVSYDLLKRSSSVIEGHQGDAFYYVTELFVNTYYTGLFYLLAFLIVIAAVIGLKSGRIHFSRIKPIWNDLVFYGLWILVPTLLYSIAKSKIKWYVYPLIYPLVIFTGLVLVTLMREYGRKRAFRFVLLTLFAVYYSVNLYISSKVVLKTSSDQTQTLMMRCIPRSETVGRDGYLQITGSGWNQADTYVAEAYCGIKCMQGGVGKFLTDRKSAVIIMDQAEYLRYKPLLERYQTVGRLDYYFCISKAGRQENKKAQSPGI